MEDNHSDLLGSWAELWVAYEALGYDGLDGERASKALGALDRAVSVLQEREGVPLGL